MPEEFPKTTLWDCLHDGGISGAEMIEPGRLRLAVEIEYLRDLLEPGGRGFLVYLQGLKRLEIRRFGPNNEPPAVFSDPAVFAELEPDILSADETEAGVLVHCNIHVLGPRRTEYGQIDFDYDNATVTVDDGSTFSVPQLVELSKRYWDQFGK